MSKKKTRKRNYNRYSRKRVSRKRVSRKRVSRKRVSSKRVSLKRKGMRGGMDRIRSILGSVGDWLEPASPEDTQRYQEWVQERAGGPDENLEPKKQEPEALEPEEQEPEALEPEALEPENFSDLGGLVDEPNKGLKFVLIPGYNNAWGNHRLTEKEMEAGCVFDPPGGLQKMRKQEFNPGYWQSKIADLITDDNILKTTTEYNEQGLPLHCGDRQNKPFKAQWIAARSQSGIEMRNCIQNIFETHSEIPKSVISTSQGSAIFIDYMADNPEMLDNIKSIVFISPATVFNDGPSGHVARRKLEDFLSVCKDKNIRILLLLNEHGWARWDNDNQRCVAAETDERVSDCDFIIRSMTSDTSQEENLAIQIPNTTHSFDLLNVSKEKIGLEEGFVQAIKNWCENPSLETAQEISKYGTTVNL